MRKIILVSEGQIDEVNKKKRYFKTGVEWRFRNYQMEDLKAWSKNPGFDKVWNL